MSISRSFPALSVLCVPLVCLVSPAIARGAPLTPASTAAPARPAVSAAAPARPASAEPGKIAPGENLVAQGIPNIPSSLAEQVDRYTEFRSAALLDWHATRREMLIATRFADTPQLHLLQRPGGARKQLTFYHDRVASGHFNKGGGDTVVFSKDTGGGEFFQLYRHDLKSGETTLLTDGKSRNVDPVYSKSGKLLSYNSTRRNGKDTDFYVIDPEHPATDRLVVQVTGGGWSTLDWSPDDRTLLVREYVSVNESYPWLLDVASGRLSPLVERPKDGGEKIAYGEGRFARDGKGVYFTTDRESEFQRLAYLDLKTRAYTYLTAAISWDVESFDLSHDGKTLCVVTNEDGIGVLHLLDAQKKTERRPAVPAGSVGGCIFHQKTRDLGFVLSSARSPLDAYSLDLTTGKVERWSESETAVNSEKMPEPQVIRWPSFDGKNISGLYYRPPARFTGRHPVIINIHGGPEGQARPSFLGRNNYWLNELGVAVIFPNVRGSTGYGKSFLKLDNGEHREDSVKDIGALISFIATQPDLDKDRIMITGGSYGGYMTLAVASTYSDRIRCSLDVVGISNFVSFLEHTEAYRRDLRRVEYGDERDPKMRAFLTGISPLTRADRIKKPLFVVQGKNDPRVPVSEAEQIVATVRKGNTPVWYLLAKDEGHGFAKKRNADFQFYATLLFVKKYLLS